MSLCLLDSSSLRHSASPRCFHSWLRRNRLRRNGVDIRMRTQKGAGKMVSRVFGVNSEATSAIRGFVPYWGGA